MAIFDGNTINNVREYISGLNNQQKIIGLAIGIAVFIGLIFLALPKQEIIMVALYSELKSEDSGKIVEYLKANDIEYTLEMGGSKIMVDKKHVNDIKIELASQGLPENSHLGYELFDNTNLGMSEFVQKLNFRRALEGELQRTIESMDEVKKARVHIVIPKTALFKKDQKEPTASVTVHLGRGRSLNKLNVDGIQNLVANSVEGMDPNKVKVMDQMANIISREALDENSIAGKTALQHQQQQRVEQYLVDKVQSLLEGVLGVGNTRVQVNADLDFTQIEQEKTQFDPEGQVVRSEQNIKDVSESADSLSYPYVNQAKDETNQIANYEISRNVEKIIHDVGAIQRLTVSVMINGMVDIVETPNGKVLDYTPRTEEEMQQFREIVQNAIGYDPGRNDQITVLNVPFQHTLNKENYEEEFPPQWYDIPENKRILFLLGAFVLVFLLMFLILQSKEVRQRMKIAMGLPVNVVIDDYDIEEEVAEDDLDELEFDDDDLLLLPPELPEQLLLEGQEGDEDQYLEEEIESELELEKESLGDFAMADLGDEDLSEEALMKLEIKGKVEAYFDEDTESAVKILRIMMREGGED